MSREWVGRTRSSGWVMVCDRWDPPCLTRSEVRLDYRLLPLERFAAEGWFIATTHGDRCPECVAEEGGMAALIGARVGGPGAPHSLMSGSVT